jgi:GTP:adenosylcobinamide-phosphate guanylyltransferase
MSVALTESKEAGGGLTAILLAASRGEATRREFGVEHKCLLDVAGQPMIGRVLAALAESRCVADCIISIDTPAALAALPEGTVMPRRILASRNSAAASTLAALDEAGRCPVLVTTADNALLTGAVTDEFCRMARESGADLAVGLVSESVITARFPRVRRTYWRFAGGAYSSCNLYYCATPKARTIVGMWRLAEENRKKPWKVVGLLGWRPLLAYLLRRWTLAQMFAHVSGRLGVKVVPIELENAEISVDIDHVSDLHLTEEVLAARSGKGAAGQP